MEGVAREAKIAKTVVYDLFGNREDLLQACSSESRSGRCPTSPRRSRPRSTASRSSSSAGASPPCSRRCAAHPDTWRLILLPAEGTPPAVRTAVDRHRDRLVRQIEPMVGWGVGELGLAGSSRADRETILALFENAIRLR